MVGNVSKEQALQRPSAVTLPVASHCYNGVKARTVDVLCVARGLRKELIQHFMYRRDWYNKTAPRYPPEENLPLGSYELIYQVCWRSRQCSNPIHHEFMLGLGRHV